MVQPVFELAFWKKDQLSPETGLIPVDDPKTKLSKFPVADFHDFHDFHDQHLEIKHLECYILPTICLLKSIPL